jgi:hypothetical protein
MLIELRPKRRRESRMRIHRSNWWGYRIRSDRRPFHLIRFGIPSKQHLTDPVAKRGRNQTC